MIYIAVYLISIAVIWTNLKNRVANLENKIYEIKQAFDKVLYTQQGALNLMSPDQCEKHRAEIKMIINDKIDKIENKIDKIENKIDRTNKELKIVDKNILLIATKLNVNTTRNEAVGILYEKR